MDKKVLAYTYILISQLFFIAWPIFSTLSFGYYNLPTMLSLWFGTAAIFSFLMIIFLKKTKEYSGFKTHWKPILLSTSLDAISIIMTFYTLRMLGPSLNGFLGKISILIMLLFGVLFLKEKFNKIEAMSALIIIFGVFIVSFSTGNYVFKGVLLLVVGSISYASSKYLIKSKLQKISPLFLSHYRVSVAAVYILSFALLSGQFQPYISKGLLFTTLPAIFSAVFGHILMYKAYKLIEISKIELIFASQPFLVSIASYIVFREVLTLQQFLGGFLIVGGIIWLIYAKNHININIKLNFIKNKFMLSKTGKK